MRLKPVAEVSEASVWHPSSPARVKARVAVASPPLSIYDGLAGAGTPVVPTVVGTPCAQDVSRFFLLTTTKGCHTLSRPREWPLSTSRHVADNILNLEPLCVCTWFHHWLLLDIALKMTWLLKSVFLCFRSSFELNPELVALAA